MKHNLPLSLKIERGAIGKEYVIKHYGYGVIKTKFPDITRIIASMQQRKCRNLFKEAVAYAKVVIADPERKKQLQKRIRMSNGVFNDAIKYFMLKDKKARELALFEMNRLLRMAIRKEAMEAQDVQGGDKPSTREDQGKLVVKDSPIVNKGPG